MIKSSGQENSASELRRRAEDLIRDQASGANLALKDEDIRRLLHELQVHQVELELQNHELRQSRAALEEARDQYRDLYDRAPVGYLTLDEKGIIRQANLTAARMLSSDRGRLEGQSLYGFVEQEHRGALLRRLKAVAETASELNLEIQTVSGGGAKFPVQLAISTLSGDESPARGFRVVIVDISRLKAAESQLRQANERLEDEVEIRTAELIATNKVLEEEIKQREEAARELGRQKEALVSKTEELEQSNIAVGVLLRRSEQDRMSMEENIMQQVHKLLLPCLKNVLATRLDTGQRLGIEAALSHLESITSSFAKKLGSPSLGLSARELQIAGMINQGLSSKDIAESLHMSPDTVSFHRRNIRRKLGITDTNTSLAMHLREFA
ncbi:MAG: PAS domain S-box protein [Desulfarculus sp.]|nr:PAS domain S-box protein [Desulfarculus sp.]